MKLVEILAKDLGEWPLRAKTLTQDDDKAVNMYSIEDPLQTDGGGVWRYLGFIEYLTRTDELATDHATAIINREMWQAEREKQSGGKWIRHRGGKCPVEAGTLIDVRFRDTEVFCGAINPECMRWEHIKSDGDIMAYKISSNQPERDTLRDKIQEGIQAADEGKTTPIAEVKARFRASPLAYRDTIIHCQAIIEDCQREIERNTQLLAAEGLALIPAMTPVLGVSDVDMSDWRNWEAGMILRCTKSNAEGIYDVGNLYKVKKVTTESALVYDELGGESACNIDDDEVNVSFVPA